MAPLVSIHLQVIYIAETKFKFRNFHEHKNLHNYEDLYETNVHFVCVSCILYRYNLIFQCLLLIKYL
jgi:hypothetical protein